METLKYYVEYRGDFWNLLICLFIGHRWGRAGKGRFCNRCWRVEGTKIS